MSGDTLMAIGAVLIACGATAATICIAMLAAANEWPVAVTVPLAEGQWVSIDTAGEYSVRGDTAGKFTLVFVGLRFTLQAANGTEVIGFRPPGHSRGPNGVPLWRFVVPVAGSYYLRVWGLRDRDLTPFQLMFLRVLPFKGWGYLGGLAIGGACFLGGLLMMIWRG
ncbi:MAG TPA: hypothetical protein VHY33_01625 [Thermoanaerobaculia bacterium]|jgi:hypothetical protein|nr:hypothetical protein [Thermoanaerobaculia bacterium]